MSESARLSAEWATKLTCHDLMIRDEWTRLKLYFIEMGAIGGYQLFLSYYKAHASEHHGLVYVMPLHIMSNSQCIAEHTRVQMHRSLTIRELFYNRLAFLM